MRKPEGLVTKLKCMISLLLLFFGGGGGGGQFFSIQANTFFRHVGLYPILTACCQSIS